jgi:hypothetical protein
VIEGTRNVIPALCLWVLGSSKLKEPNQLAEVLHSSAKDPRKFRRSSAEVPPKSNLPKLQNTTQGRDDNNRAWTGVCRIKNCIPGKIIIRYWTVLLCKPVIVKNKLLRIRVLLGAPLLWHHIILPPTFFVKVLLLLTLASLRRFFFARFLLF